MLLTCAASSIWVETANSLPQLFPDSHQRVDMAFASSFSWAGDGFPCSQVHLQMPEKPVSFLHVSPNSVLPLLLSPYSLPGAILIQKSVIKSW